MVDFTLKNSWVIHEKLPQGRIVATRTIQYENDLVPAIVDAPPAPATEETLSAEEIPPVVEEIVTQVELINK